MMKRMRRSAMSGILAVLMLGCGSGDPLGVGVSGIVTYKGQPIKEGLISFIPLEGTNGPKAGANIDDGKFAIPRRGALVPGKYRVEIRAFEDGGKETAKSTQQSQMFGRPLEQITTDPGAAEQLQKLRMEKNNIIPARYNDNSELTKELPNEHQVTMDFEL
jgi:hypothetical protein